MVGWGERSGHINECLIGEDGFYSSISVQLFRVDETSRTRSLFHTFHHLVNYSGRVIESNAPSLRRWMTIGRHEFRTGVMRGRHHFYFVLRAVWSRSPGERILNVLHRKFRRKNKLWRRRDVRDGCGRCRIAPLSLMTPMVELRRRPLKWTVELRPGNVTQYNAKMYEEPRTGGIEKTLHAYGFRQNNCVALRRIPNVTTALL